MDSMSLGLRIAYFLSLLLVALALAPAMAHLLALPNKVGLPREEYFAAQQIYRGWALLGIVVFAALLSTAVLTMMLYGRAREFALSLVTLLCIAAAIAVFFIFTFPANQVTNNWTNAPDNWLELRRQWEYSHAAGAALYLIGFATLILSALSSKGRAAG
jgi:hypothetical protein